MGRNTPNFCTLLDNVSHFVRHVPVWLYHACLSIHAQLVMILVMVRTSVRETGTQIGVQTLGNDILALGLRI